ncbi:MAG: hypothetical protein P8Y26_02045 [Gemmatimonadales bacterium]
MRRPALASLALTAALVLSLPGASAGQDDVRAAAALFPDTVHVGQPFRIGVTVTTPRGAEVRLPGVLEATEDLEQAGEAEIGRRRPRTGASRAYYRMVAWTAGEHEVPPIKVQVFLSEGEAEPLEIVVPVPKLTVETVLPAEIAGLELRQALPYLRPLPFPLLLILALIALLVGLWAYRTYGKREEEDPEEAPRELTSWERALEELKKLVSSWGAGELTLEAFCDGLEAVLRGYLEATESWAPGVPTRAVVNGNRALADALYFSARVRFARLGGGYGGPIEASDACGAWIASRHEPPELGEEETS